MKGEGGEAATDIYASPPSLKLPPTLKLRRDKMADKRRGRSQEFVKTKKES